MIKAAAVAGVSIFVSIAAQEQWPDQAGYFWALTALCLLALVTVWAWPYALPWLGGQLAPYVAPHLPEPPPAPTPAPAPVSAYEDPVDSERLHAYRELREMVGSGQELRAKMSHAAHWLEERQGSDKFGYYDWRSKVLTRLIAILPEDADHFSKPPEARMVGDDDFVWWAASPPNRKLLIGLEDDLGVLTRLLKFHAR